MNDNKWCMCLTLKGVYRDFDTTCCQCGGKDAYGSEVLGRGEEYAKPCHMAVPEPAKVRKIYVIINDMIAYCNGDETCQFCSYSCLCNLVYGPAHEHSVEEFKMLLEVD